MKRSVADAFYDLYLTTTIPFLVIDNNGKEEAAFPKDFLQFYKRSLLLHLTQALEASAHPNGILLYQLGDFYYCAVTKLDDNCCLVTAPVCSSNVSSDIMISQIIRYVNSERINDLKFIIPYFPIISDYRLGKFASLSRLIYGSPPAQGICIEHNISNEPEYETTSDALSGFFPQENVSSDLMENGQIQRLHHSVYFSEGMEKAIMQGDADAFTVEYRKPMIGAIGQMSLNPLRQAKYTFMCAILSINHAAIEGGLPSEYALQLCDMYCQRMDVMTSIHQVEQLIYSAGVDHCKKVQQYSSQRNYSSYTKIVLDHIRRHLYEPIKMKDLTFEADLNRRSLSIYFQKDTGLGITDYITRQRLEEAKVLLTTTNLSLVQISELLCFSSQSYFGKKYKAYWGITPKKYRDSLPV